MKTLTILDLLLISPLYQAIQHFDKQPIHPCAEESPYFEPHFLLNLIVRFTSLMEAYQDNTDL